MSDWGGETGTHARGTQPARAGSTPGSTAVTGGGPGRTRGRWAFLQNASCLVESHTGVRLTRYAVLAGAVALLLAGALVWFAMYRADRYLRATLSAQARIAASALNPDRVGALSGSPADTASADYVWLKRQLIRMHEANPSIRFLYLMRQRSDGAVVFLVDSEPPGSPEESKPGQPYEEASVWLRSVFTEGVEITEGPLLDRWGTWVTAAVPVRDGSGRLLAVLGIDEDAKGWRARVALGGALPSIFVVLSAVITLLALRLRRVNRRTTESQQALRALFRSSPAGIGVVVERRFVEVTDRLCDMLGYTPRELIGQSVRMIYPTDEEFERVGREKYAQIRERGLGTIETRFRRKDGVVFDVLLSSAAMDPADVSSPVVFAALDITGHKKAEEDLRVQAKYFEELFDGAPEAIAIVSNDDVVQRINREFVRLFEYSPEEAVGRRINELIVPDDLAEEGAAATSSVARGERVRFESVRRSKSGRRIPVSVLGTPVTLGGAQLGVYAMYRDMTESKRSEQCLRESEERYRTIVESMGEGLLQVDHDDRIVFANEQFCRMVGRSREELVGKIGYELFAEDEVGRALIQEKNALRRRGVTDRYESTIRRADGVNIPAMITGAPVRGPDGVIVGSVGLITDLTEMRRAEQERAQLQERYLQAQKMEAVGRLAGGVAHDFNNMLQVILGHVEMALGRVTEAGLRADLEEVRAAARRSAEITRQLLGFARRQTVAPRVVDLNEVVEETLGMLRRLIGEDIQLRWRPEVGLHAVRIDPVQVDQILANLSVNARDAMPRGGTLEIETHNEADSVVVVVRDHGVGMSDEVKRHLFEPFFTTKPTGEGTGLGLATVKGIAEQNGGRVEIDSTLGVGTDVRVYLPACEATRHALAPPVEAHAAHAGERVVLVVEDEEAILSMVKRMGEALGYRVVAAASIEEAEHAARREAIDVVLTDVVMPGKSGREVAEIIRRARPQAKVVFMSGYPADEMVRRGIEAGAVFVQKPFTMDELGQKIREALGR